MGGRWGELEGLHNLTAPTLCSFLPTYTPPTPLPCSAIFATTTAARLGGQSVVATTSDTTKLAVWLDYSANIDVGAPIALLAKPAVVAWLDSRMASGGAAVTLQVGPWGGGAPGSGGLPALVRLHLSFQALQLPHPLPGPHSRLPPLPSPLCPPSMAPPPWAPAAAPPPPPPPLMAAAAPRARAGVQRGQYSCSRWLWFVRGLE